jgi:GDP-L-fucose synthase
MKLEGATVVVTGGTGFLGRHVTKELRNAGAKPISLGSRDYDLRKRAQIDQMLADTTPYAVVHLAAVVGGIGANRAEPGRFFYENAVMGIELIEACRIAEVPKLAIAGTVCSYPKFTPVPFREEDLWNGYPEETNAPYGLAKKMLLAQAQAYRAQYGMNIIYLLPVNLYGPGDNFDLETSHVIPAMIRKFVEALVQRRPTVMLWGDGSPTREFLYVSDAARAVRAALEQYDEPAPVNIGTGREVSIRDLAELVRSATSYPGDIEWDTSKPNGQPRRGLNAAFAYERFGFAPEVDLNEGLREVVTWYLRQEGRASVSAAWH